MVLKAQTKRKWKKQTTKQTEKANKNWGTASWRQKYHKVRIFIKSSPNHNANKQHRTIQLSNWMTRLFFFLILFYFSFFLGCFGLVGTETDFTKKNVFVRRDAVIQSTGFGADVGLAATFTHRGKRHPPSYIKKSAFVVHSERCTLCLKCTDLSDWNPTNWCSGVLHLLTAAPRIYPTQSTAKTQFRKKGRAPLKIPATRLRLSCCTWSRAASAAVELLCVSAAVLYDHMWLIIKTQSLTKNPS